MNPADTYDEHVISWQLARTLNGQVDELRRNIHTLLSPFVGWLSRRLDAR